MTYEEAIKLLESNINLLPRKYEEATRISIAAIKNQENIENFIKNIEDLERITTINSQKQACDFLLSLADSLGLRRKNG